MVNRLEWWKVCQTNFVTTLLLDWERNCGFEFCICVIPVGNMSLFRSKIISRKRKSMSKHSLKYFFKNTDLTYRNLFAYRKYFQFFEIQNKKKFFFSFPKTNEVVKSIQMWSLTEFHDKYLKTKPSILLCNWFWAIFNKQ